MRARNTRDGIALRLRSYYSLLHSALPNTQTTSSRLRGLLATCEESPQPREEEEEDPGRSPPAARYCVCGVTLELLNLPTTSTQRERALEACGVASKIECVYPLAPEPQLFHTLSSSGALLLLYPLPSHKESPTNKQYLLSAVNCCLETPGNSSAPIITRPLQSSLTRELRVSVCDGWLNSPGPGD